MIIRGDEADPLGPRLRLAWVKVVVGPEGETAAVRRTVPEKPFRLTSWTCVVAELPAWTDRVVGDALTVKSGMGNAVTVIVLEVELVWLAESATVSVTVKLPAAEYMCVTVAPEPVVPSPNAHAYE